MSRRCVFFVIWCLAFALSDRPLVAQEEDWIGLKVLESRPGVTLKSGKRVIGKMSDLGATPLVLETQGDWLRVGTDARSGWVQSRDVVTIDEAPEYFTRAIKASPKRSWAYNLRGIALQEVGRYDEALKDYSIAVRLNPRDAAAHNNRAWILATCPDDQQRDGQLALSSAMQACKLTKYRQPIYLDTLAAAYAAAGDFKSAYNWQAKAIKQLPHDKDFQREARERLELYASAASFEPTTTDRVQSIETEPAELNTAESPSSTRRRRR